MREDAPNMEGCTDRGAAAAAAAAVAASAAESHLTFEAPSVHFVLGSPTLTHDSKEVFFLRAQRRRTPTGFSDSCADCALLRQADAWSSVRRGFPGSQQVLCQPSCPSIPLSANRILD